MTVEIPESIQSLQQRLHPDGDLNAACQAIEPLINSNPANGANVFYHLLMNIITLSADGETVRMSQKESQAARFSQAAVDGFEAQYGEDGQFTDLIAAIKAVIPDLNAIFIQRSQAAQRDSGPGF